MIKFEPLQEAKIPEITNLMEDFYAIDGYPIEREVTLKNFQLFVSDPNLGHAWLMKDGTETIGYIIVSYFFSFEFKGRVMLLDELFIHEKARGKGAGRQAIHFVKAFAEQQAFKLIVLEVESHNVKAAGLYEKEGFSYHQRKLMRQSI